MVNAEIYNVEGFSGHADKPALLNWIGSFKEKPGRIFIVHGEKESKESFCIDVKEKFNIDCIIPEYDVIYEIKKKNLINEVVLVDEKQKIKDKYIQELLKEVEELKKAFENALAKTEGCLLVDDIDIDKFRKINNNIKSLENEIMNLTMISAK